MTDVKNQRPPSGIVLITPGAAAFDKTNVIMTVQERASFLMANAHITRDLGWAMTLEGIGTDKDFACIGDIVAEGMKKFNTRSSVES